MEYHRILQELITERDKLQRAIENIEEMALVAWANFEPGVLRAQAVCYCFRYGHTWVKRTKAKPRYCPKCGRYNWDIPTGKLPIGRPPKKPLS